MKRTVPDTRSAAAALALLVGISSPIGATSIPPRIDYVAEEAAIGRYQNFDQRLQDVGWRLVRDNAAFCPRVIPAIGLRLQDLASYGRPDIARATLRLERDFAVQTAAKDSPAEKAGGFDRNREVVRLGHFDPNEWPAGKRTDWQRVARAHNHIDALLTEYGGMEVGFADGGARKVAPVEVCATRFELMGEGTAAVADGERVVIGMEIPAFSYDEAMFAAVVAHELAHNLLGHAEWLDRNGRSWGKVKRTEREADRLIPWLLANAGYEPEAAALFMREWGAHHGTKLLRAPTHNGWRKRLTAIEEELPVVAEALASEGRADWSRRFHREIDPAQDL
jgi:hypothetical protein